MFHVACFIFCYLIYCTKFCCLLCEGSNENSRSVSLNAGFITNKFICFDRWYLNGILCKYGPNNISFKLLSLNARGILSFEKRKALFGWLTKNKSDICFLQESYSTPEVEKIWKSQWKGEMFFSHGTEHSKVVLSLIKNSLEFELKTTKVDENGCFIVLEANVKDHPLLFVNEENERAIYIF